MKEIMKTIKEIITERRLKVKEERELEIKRHFKVVERGNTLWLTHDGVAFLEIPSGKTASDVAKMLSDARTAAITYDGL